MGCFAQSQPAVESGAYPAQVPQPALRSEAFLFGFSEPMGGCQHRARMKIFKIESPKKFGGVRCITGES